ncbi:hypothetical protein I79_013898 [Cricetulus griseus]|uniref:Uncharacterized protein n=1 Tax=Cricetulus griseus TaxID=10029 RepID=G3HSQ4_CRIGR|nr:hypothetical protein I79_013898 [Cricetulus griseus]
MKPDFCLELDGGCGWDSSEQKGVSSFWLMNPCRYVCSVRNPTACIDTTLDQSLNKQIHIRPAYTHTKAEFLYSVTDPHIYIFVDISTK